MTSVRDSLADALLSELLKVWNPAAHPRNPEGMGDISGQFVSTGGPGASSGARGSSDYRRLVPRELIVEARQSATAHQFPAGSVRNTSPKLAEEIAAKLHLRDQYNKAGRSTEMLYEHEVGGLPKGVWTRARSQLHRQLRRKWRRENADIPHEKVAVVFAGLPGSGKGYAQSDDLGLDLGFDKSRMAVIDPDKVKGDLIEADPSDYAGLPGLQAAGLYHEESSTVADEILTSVTTPGSPDYGKNVVYDYVMSSESSGGDKIERLQKAGYKVRVVLVDAEPEVALANAEDRYKETGRLIAFDAATRDAETGTNAARDAFNAVRSAAATGTPIKRKKGPDIHLEPIEWTLVRGVRSGSGDVPEVVARSDT